MKFGMDFGGTNIKAGVFDDDGNIIRFTEKKLAELSAGGNLLENLILHAKEIIEGYSISRGGLAIKGLVNTVTGVVESDIGAAGMLAGVNLKSAFSKALGFPFSVENDARAYAYGEYLFGAGKGSNALACMTLGTGLGCALILKGKTYYGSDSSGGLLGGHISIDRNGGECSCGNIGCLEMYCSATALTERIIAAGLTAENREEILPRFFKKAADGDKENKELFDRFIDDLSIGVVNVIHAYGPDTVVLGGGVLNSADIILPPLTALVNKRAWTFPKNKVQIKSSQLGNRAAAIGVAFLE